VRLVVSLCVCMRVCVCVLCVSLSVCLFLYFCAGGDVVRTVRSTECLHPYGEIVYVSVSDEVRVNQNK